jgi:hypothetical protein
MFRSLLSIAALCVLASVKADHIQIGDDCGVDGSKFLDFSFGGSYRVSGAPGCTLEGQTGCYCAPIVGDGDPTANWIWQCESLHNIEFGPKGGKTCPAVEPVPRGYVGELRPTCDTTLHPTGLAGDPSCPFATCDQPGGYSSLCGCVDLELYGLGEGMNLIVALMPRVAAVWI